MNIFEALRVSHETQRALADQLLKTQGDSPERATLFKALRAELAAHETAEERCFYIPLMDHETQRALADQLLRTQGDSPERATLFKALRAELAAHETAEERCFYMPLMDHDVTMDASRHGIAEHHEMDEMVEEMEKTAPDSSAWIAIAKQLHHKIFHHLEDEEQGIFQLAGKVLTEKQKTALATEYEGEFTSQRVKEATA